MAPRGGPREPKGEPNGAQMGVKIASKIEFDFQTIFDAKIMLSRPGNCSGSSFPVRFYTRLQRLAKIPPWQIQPQLAINLSRRLHSFG